MAISSDFHQIFGKPATKRTTPRDWLRPRRLALLVVCGTLAGCASYRDVAPNSPVAVVEQTMGRPDLTCPGPNGGTRAIWTRQPNGQYAYGANINGAGIADQVVPVLTDANFRKLDQGNWTPQDVLCEFGPPSRTSRSGLGEKNEVVWEYRYKQANVWNSLMYVYLGPDGQRVTHHHPGPDPAFEHEFEFMRF